MNEFTDFEVIRQDMTPDKLPQMCGLMDKDFARLIGVRKQHWNAMKKGNAPITQPRQAFFDSLIWMYYHGGLESFVKFKLSKSD